MISQRFARTLAVAALFGAAGLAPARAEAPLPLARATAAESADFDVFLPPRSESALARLVADQTRPGAARYHHWLTPAQFKAGYAATPATFAAARAALAQAGLRVVGESAQSLHVAASAADVEAAFGVRLTHSQFAGGMQALVANRALTLPKALAGLGARVPQFTTAPPAHPHSRIVSLNFASSLGAYFPADLRQAYDYPDVTKLNGSGVTIAVLMSFGYNAKDMTAFFNAEFLPASLQPKISTVVVNGGSAFSATNSLETHLDIQQSAGVAPGVAEILYNLPSLSQDDILSGLVAIVSDNKADVVNMSFGLQEAALLPINNLGLDLTYVTQVQHWLFEQGNAQGITFVASSGDFGGDPVTTTCTTLTACKTGPTVAVEEPASDPNVTGVGGTNLVTKFTKGNNDSTYVRENANPDPIAGKNAGNWGSGGGISKLFAKPSWQGLVTTGSSAFRTVPDVAMHMGGCPAAAAKPCGADRSADKIEIGGKMSGAIGTSAAAPDFAGLLALKVKLTGGRLGNANPDIYARAHAQIAAGTDGTPFRHAHITGSNGVYSVKAPYDLVIGNGTVDGRQFIGATKLPAAGALGSASNP